MTDKYEAQCVAALKEIAETNWPYITQLNMHHAKMTKIRYDSYLKAGFSEAEALYFIVNGVK